MTIHKTRRGFCYGKVEVGGAVVIVLMPQGETEDTGRAA